MGKIALPDGVSPPDFYVAAIGRSGSTMLCNWLCRPPDQLVFIEPFFLRPSNPRLLRIQLADFGLPASDAEWAERDESGPERFRRIMGPRLAGKKWAFKEELAEEHSEALDAFAPPRVLLTVRNLRDVALSFFEKHRLQANLDRFDDAWVREYCARESEGMLCLLERLRNERVPHRVVRYEDFTRSEADRHAIAEFVGWQGGGRIDSHLQRFDRQFEVERHGPEISSRLRSAQERALGPEEQVLACEIARLGGNYQRQFGYEESGMGV
jgi:hypothetical protein